MLCIKEALDIAATPQTLGLKKFIKQAPDRASEAKLVCKDRSKNTLAPF
jgi:hypothetical protein